MLKQRYILFFFPLFFVACAKEQILNPERAAPVSVNIQGAVLTTDTLELVFNNKVLGEIPDSRIRFQKAFFNPGDKIILRKKIGGEVLKTFDVAAQPFNQVKKFFYDGATLSDNITLTPVSDPNKMGFRFRFSTTFKGFYGGPVDIELYDVNAYTFDIITLKKIENVTGVFGDFVELPPLQPDHDYYFKVYKAGTAELP